MRKYLKGWPLFAFILFFVLMIQGVRAEESSPLAQIAEGLKNQQIEVDGWTLHAKTNVDISSEQFSKKVKRLKDELRQYEWTEKKNNMSPKSQEFTKMKKMIQNRKFYS
nr:hypothetical protein [Bacillus safensis]MDI0191496.1 hypothetical protein [Bacillus safensis]WEZ17993.1 hypothetical protein P5638_05110 [Bacillus safensis]